MVVLSEIGPTNGSVTPTRVLSVVPESAGRNTLEPGTEVPGAQTKIVPSPFKGATQREQGTDSPLLPSLCPPVFFGALRGHVSGFVPFFCSHFVL